MLSRRRTTEQVPQTGPEGSAAGFALLAVIGRPLGGWLSDRVGPTRILLVCFVSVGVLALVLAAAYTAMVPLSIACLTMAVALGLGTGAVFKLVPEWFPDRVGSVTGVVGAAGGLGGFFPPLVIGIVKSATGGYALGFALMALVAVACSRVLRAPALAEASRPGAGAAPHRPPMSEAAWLAVRWLHVLAMALFVGGQLVLVAAIVPALRGTQREALRAVARRFGWASLAALAVLVATGSAFAGRDERWSSGTLQVKLALVVAVGCLIVWHLRRPGAHAIEGLVFLVSVAIVWLGLALAHGPLPFG